MNRSDNILWSDTKGQPHCALSLKHLSCVIETRLELLLLLFYRQYFKEMCYRYVVPELRHGETISSPTVLILSELLCRLLFVRLKQHTW